MPTDAIEAITYSAFVEMFEPHKDFSGYEDDGTIEIEWEAVPCKNPAREADDWYAFLWKPASEIYTGKRMRVEYKGSSTFAFWWNDITDWKEDEVCETCDKTLKPGEGKSQLTGSFSCVVCPDCYEEEEEENE